MDFYYFQESRLSLKIIVEYFIYNIWSRMDHYLYKIKQDIIETTRKSGIESIDIKYRWSPISSDIKSNKQIKIYFYWTSDISFDCVRNCIKTRFGERILLSTNCGSINCARNMDVTTVCMSSKNECIQRCTSQEYGTKRYIDDHCKDCVSLKASNTNYLQHFEDFDYVLIPQKSLLILDDDDDFNVDTYYSQGTTKEIVTLRYETINVCLNNLFDADVQSIIFLFYGSFQFHLERCVDYEDDWCAVDRNYNDDIVKYSHSKAHVSGFEYVHRPIPKSIDLPQPDSGYLLYITSSDTADDNAISGWETVGQCESPLYLIGISRSTSELSDTCYISNTSTTKMIDL